MGQTDDQNIMPPAKAVAGVEALKTSSLTPDIDTDPPDKLKKFYGRFEKAPTTS